MQTRCQQLRVRLPAIWTTLSNAEWLWSHASYRVNRALLDVEDKDQHECGGLLVLGKENLVLVLRYCYCIIAHMKWAILAMGYVMFKVNPWFVGMPWLKIPWNSAKNTQWFCSEYHTARSRKLLSLFTGSSSKIALLGRYCYDKDQETMSGKCRVCQSVTSVFYLICSVLDPELIFKAISSAWFHKNSYGWSTILNSSLFNGYMSINWYSRSRRVILEF